MGWDEDVDCLTRRVRLFEKCYMNDFVSLLANIQFYADDIHSGSSELIGRDICREKMNNSLGRLEKYFLGLPPELGTIDLCGAHVSVLEEFWEEYYQESMAFLEDGFCDKSRCYSSGLVVKHVCQSLERCIDIDPEITSLLDDTCNAVFAIDNFKEYSERYRLTSRDLTEEAYTLLTAADKCLNLVFMIYPYEGEFAPLMVSGYLLQDLSYWARVFLDEGDESQLCCLSELSIAMSQLGSKFKSNYRETLDELRNVPGYEGFETRTSESEGGTILSGGIEDNTR